MKALWISLALAGLLAVGATAWILSVAPAFSTESLYVKMQDGARIAIDLYLPKSRPSDERLPTILRATRYWRGYELGTVGRAFQLFGMTFDDDAADWIRAGYALVVVDVRGSGASSGSWEIIWSPQEIADLGEIVEWIVEQPWSNGRIGAYGVSYDGNTAELLMLNRHPAVKAVAPQYGDFDVYRQLLYPGGVYNRGFVETWASFTAGLDRNDPCALASIVGEDCRSLSAIISGVRPVDDVGDSCGACELAEAVAGHRPIDLAGWTAAHEYADDPFGRTGLSLVDVSPCSLRDAIEASGVPMFVWASWLDGASAEGALSRYASLGNPQRLVVGAWSHGGKHNADPFAVEEAPPDPDAKTQFEWLVGFFNRHLRSAGADEPTGGIAYYTLGERVWKKTDVWPPAGFESTVWYLGPGETLSTRAPATEAGSDTYLVDWTATTGPTSRWRTNLDESDVVYPDRAAEDAKLLVYTSGPFLVDTEITGTPAITLYVSSTHADGALHVYLEDVAPGGRVTYITEGMLRLSQRAVSVSPYVTQGPYHSQERADVESLVPGEVTSIEIALYTTSVLIRKGHAIRIAIAGHDASTFARYPAEGTPSLTFERNNAFPSRVVLPIRARDASS